MVLIPALNEAECISATVQSWREAGAQVRVIDNGSTDGTAGMAASAGAHDSRRCANCILVRSADSSRIRC